MQTGGKQVPLQHAHLSIPAGHDLTGLTFVIHSDDSTAWWRDGAWRDRLPLSGFHCLALPSAEQASPFQCPASACRLRCMEQCIFIFTTEVRQTCYVHPGRKLCQVYSDGLNQAQSG